MAAARLPGTYRVRADGREWLATENLVPGRSVYREHLVVKKGTEYRTWDPHRSKLAAAVLNGLQNFAISDGSSVLYLGASTGTTASHVSDIVGPRGRVFAVEHTSRVARDLLDRVVSHRTNMVPVIQDARHPDKYFSVFGKVDAVYADIAQPDQTDIALDNCRAYLKKGGTLFLVVKTRSIDVLRDPSLIVKEEEERVSKSMRVLEVIDLEPYEKDHAMIIAQS